MLDENIEGRSRGVMPDWDGLGAHGTEGSRFAHTAGGGRLVEGCLQRNNLSCHCVIP